MAKRKKHEEHENLERWLVSYADFMTLLFALFVVMYAVSSVNEGKYRVLSDSMQEAFTSGRVRSQGSSPSAIFKSTPAMKSSLRPSTKDVKGALTKLSRRYSTRAGDGAPSVELFEDYRGLVLRVAEDGFFDSGKAELKPSCWPFLEDLGLLARDVRSTVEVEAHTDDRPLPPGGRFRSNWDLSALRSTAVVEYLLNTGNLPGERLRAIGRADSSPVVPNSSGLGRARNRRVEFVFAEEAHPPQAD